MVQKDDTEIKDKCSRNDNQGWIWGLVGGVGLGGIMGVVSQYKWKIVQALLKLLTYCCPCKKSADNRKCGNNWNCCSHCHCCTNGSDQNQEVEESQMSLRSNNRSNGVNTNISKPGYDMSYLN